MVDCSWPLNASRGRVATGSVVSNVRVIRHKGRRPVLSITTSRRTRLYVHESGRRRAHAIRARRRCAAVRVTLARPHGRAQVIASLRVGAERRTVIY